MSGTEIAAALKTPEDLERVNRLKTLLRTDDEARAIRSAMRITISLLGHMMDGTVMVKKPDGTLDEIFLKRNAE